MCSGDAPIACPASSAVVEPVDVIHPVQVHLSKDFGSFARQCDDAREVPLCATI